MSGRQPATFLRFLGLGLLLSWSNMSRMALIGRDLSRLYFRSCPAVAIRVDKAPGQWQGSDGLIGIPLPIACNCRQQSRGRRLWLAISPSVSLARFALLERSKT
jgi:hypothetical protein